MAYDLVQSVSFLNKAHVSPAGGGQFRREKHTSAGEFSKRKDNVKTLFKINEYKTLQYKHHHYSLSGLHEVVVTKFSNKNYIVHKYSVA